MHCPFCQAEDTKVIDSRLVEDGSQTRRRRECEICHSRFTTFETADLALPRVVKNDGERLHGFYDIFSTGFWSDLQIDHFSIFQPNVAWIRRALFWRLGPCHNSLIDKQRDNEAKGLFHVDISTLTSVLSRMA